MPLIKSILVNELTRFIDAKSDNFIAFPKTQEEAGNMWADAVAKYSESIVPPSTTVDSARDAFMKNFAQINFSNGILQLNNCFVSYATILGAGMAPLFTGVPPTSNLDFSPVQVLGMGGGTSKECIEMFAGIIDVWFKTGSAINNISGVKINWI